MDNERTPTEELAAEHAMVKEQDERKKQQLSGLLQQALDGVEADRLRQLSTLVQQVAENKKSGLSLYEFASLRKLEASDEPLTDEEISVIDRVDKGDELEFSEQETLITLIGLVD
jgi:hypothetical protein